MMTVELANAWNVRGHFSISHPERIEKLTWASRMTQAHLGIKETSWEVKTESIDFDHIFYRVPIGLKMCVHSPRRQ